MFEFSNDFLMGPKTALQNGEFDNRLCQASSKADEELEQLAQLVGMGSTLAPSNSDPVARVDDAPALEFDLEDELARAFQSQESAPPPAPPRSPLFDTSAIETALAQPASPQQQQRDPFAPSASAAPVAPAAYAAPAASAAPAAPMAASAADPAMDFNDMIADELDRALAAEVAADPQFAVPSAKPNAPEPPAYPVDPNSQEGIEAELSKLMGDVVSDNPQPPAPVPAAAAPAVREDKFDRPPIPGAVLDPWPKSEIVVPPELPQAEEQVSEPAREQQWQPPQMNDFEPPAVDYSDPAAEFFEDPKDPIAQPENSGGKGHIDAVLGGADALAEAAVLDGPESLARDTGSNTSSGTSGSSDAFGAELRALLDSHSTEGEPEQASDTYILANPPEKRQTGRRVAMAIVFIALLGGTAALGWNYIHSDTGETPTLLASTDPVKIKPDDAGGKIVPNQDQAVYQSVEGSDQKAMEQDRLNDSTEAPIIVATTPGTPKLDTRIPASSGSTEGGLRLKPRRVRTVVVRPDGTIVSATAGQDQANVNEVALETPVLTLQPPVFDSELTTAATDRAATASEPATTRPESPAAATPKPAETLAAATPKPQPVTLKPLQTEVAPAAPVKPKPVQVAAAPQPTASVDDENLPSVSSPYAVQVSSQRSAAAAKQTYVNLTRRYGGILDGKGVDIKKAVVSGKGTYYRVRIPAESRSAANSICSQLKARGGDCFVTR